MLWLCVLRGDYRKIDTHAPPDLAQDALERVVGEVHSFFLTPRSPLFSDAKIAATALMPRRERLPR
jgi:hypothetical protein